MQQSPEKLPENRIEHLRSLRLSGAERSALRASLIAKMRLPAGRQGAGNFRRPIRSPWSGLFATRRFQAAFLIMVIIIGYGSSAALAAEGSLPGDILYPVKTKVVEPLARLVAARTPEHEAAFETNLLERRLREAEALDVAATLEAPLREEVRERIRAQSARAETTARRADEESDEEFPELPPSSDAHFASSTVATGSPARLEDARRPERGSDKRDRGEKRTERAMRVLKEHKRILEKLELSNESGDERKEREDD